jgi:hypothetical protein
MSEWKLMLLGLALGCLAALALGLWARAQLRTAAERLRASEAGRQQEMQFTTAARRQIEALQNELAELRALLARRGVQAPPRPVAVDGPQASSPDCEPERASDGFQATQIVPRTPG